MFGFMQSACPESCGWCGSKGCVDEYQGCQQWVRDGMCALNPFLMAHTCRESCGVCGFLSPTSKEEQEKDGRSYTDFEKDNFECGRYKSLAEINPANFTANENNSSDGNTKDFFCSATLITDRWALGASHCNDDFQVGASIEPKQIRLNTIRTNTPYKESVEVKRIFKHPHYKFTNLYNDIALLELGRRVEYDYDRYGDTPSCLDSGIDLTGKTGSVQGYGVSETGKRGTLLETNVTIISNEECRRTLDDAYGNISMATQKVLTQALPEGLNYGIFCGKDAYAESCKLSSGGPLTTTDDQGRKTVVGIVSWIGCHKTIPGWYTRVNFHLKWIQCIIKKSKSIKKKIDIENACLGAVEEQKKCPDIGADDLIFRDIPSIDESDCKEDGTNS